MLTLEVVLAVGAILAAAILGWRFASRRWSIPCPPALVFLLDNRFTQGVAGWNIIDRLRLEPGMKVADVGCGPGRLTIPIAQRLGPGGEVVAVDIQPEMLRRARDRVGRAGLTNVRFIEAGVGEGKLGREAYDRAVMVTVLGEVPDQEAALREVYGALKSGGILSITEVIPDPHYQSPGKVKRLAEAAGFEPSERFGHWLAYTINLKKPGGG